MNSDSAALNRLWGTLLIEELVRNGVDYFCISPGSRSTPLTAAVARHPRARALIGYDERGTAFHALGYGRATAQPAALICTSGTAAANYYPAVVEAAVDGVPLIVLTADRPPELRETGANQTIRQVNLYGDYPKWHFDLPAPDARISPAMLLTTVDQLVHQARSAPPGPVHLNCMFREPFFEETGGSPPPVAGVGEWEAAENPYTRYTSGPAVPDREMLRRLIKTLRSADSGWLVVGKLVGPAEQEAVVQLAGRLGWPVLPDITSGLRLGNPLRNGVYFFDQLLLDKSRWEKQRPEVVLHLGGRLVSKRFLQFIDEQRPAHYIVIADHPRRYDPLHAVTWRLQGDLTATCEQLAAGLSTRKPDKRTVELIGLFRKVDEIIEAFVGEEKQKLSEIAVARLLSRHAPEGGALFLGSSMPVRDMDMYAAADGPRLRIAANRGASGIDGTLASAGGFAAGLAVPTTLLLGDLALLHDLNSLALLKDLPHPLVIVVVNNRGGGIFSFLPVARQDNIFETYFGTPHDYDFGGAAQMFGISYARPQTQRDFLAVYRRALRKKSATLIEVQTDREENYRQHQKLQERIETALREDRR